MLSNESFERDPHLLPFRSDIEGRFKRFLDLKRDIEANEKCSLSDFARGYEQFGLNYCEGRVFIREYLPLATSVHLCGDFNAWNRSTHPLFPEGFGRWAISLLEESIQPGQRYKLTITTQ